MWILVFLIYYDYFIYRLAGRYFWGVRDWYVVVQSILGWYVPIERNQFFFSKNMWGGKLTLIWPKRFEKNISKMILGTYIFEFRYAKYIVGTCFSSFNYLNIRLSLVTVGFLRYRAHVWIYLRRLSETFACQFTYRLCEQALKRI